ncbi:MAG: riboflavin biosynthesis protein RibF [Opitutaceae bacterium]
MNFPAQIDGLENLALPPRPLHLAIGMFDGVHLGHRAVIAEAVRSARHDGGLCGVLTFWPHPSELFRPDNPTRMILFRDTKLKLLAKLGVDLVVTEAFTPAFAAVPAEDFIPWLRQRLPSLVAVYVGENFRFGRGRRGDASLLVASGQAHGVRVISAPRITVAGEPVSSTRIRALMESGEIETANALLGYPYFATGRVTCGKRLGRTIGFPTLNVPWAPDVRPRLGVYAVRLKGARSPHSHPAVANYGLRPTVEQSTEPRLEAHLLGECPFDEGDIVTIEWLRFLRPETKFADLAALRAQIALDRAAAAKFFAS